MPSAGRYASAASRKLRRELARLFRHAGKVNWRDGGQVNVIDVGSAGDLPAPWFENARYIRNLLKFEPRDPADATANVKTVDVALWSEEGPRPFYIYKGLGGHGASLFPQNVDYVRENYADLSSRGPAQLAETWFERSELDRVEQLECRTLDQVLADDDVTYHFLKIDAQGAEYQILQGASDYLSTDCLGLHLELFTVPLYEGIKLKDDVVEYLRGRGFSLVKTLPPHGSFDSQNDCVFLRDGATGPVIDRIRSIYDLA